MTPLLTNAADPADAVLSALRDLGIDNLHVEAIADSVYVHGQAHCYDTKRRAAERAQLAAPAACIVNEVRVAHSDFRDDASVARDVEAAIAALPDDNTTVRVGVERGEVHLYGFATTARARQEIEAAVWDACCVERVHNHLRLASDALEDSDIALALDAYVQRAMNLNPGAIVVNYADGRATLSGIVKSSGQAQAIEDLVRWHERVSDVVSNLRVAMPTNALSGSAS